MKLCCVEGCGRQHDTRGYCGMHAQRVRRYGDPNYVTSNEQFRGNCRAAQVKARPSEKGAYAKRFGRHEHRVVAEQMLGRPLEPGEIVHHKDGNRRNNAPENLEVMTQAEHARIHLAERRAAGEKFWGPKRKAAG